MSRALWVNDTQWFVEHRDVWADSSGVHPWRGTVVIELSPAGSQVVVRYDGQSWMLTWRLRRAIRDHIRRVRRGLPEWLSRAALLRLLRGER